MKATYRTYIWRIFTTENSAACLMASVHGPLLHTTEISLHLSAVGTAGSAGLLHVLRRCICATLPRNLAIVASVLVTTHPGPGLNFALQTEEQLKKRVGAKLEVARFLQDTVSEMAKDMRTTKTGATQASAADLYQFMKRVSLL